MLLRETKIAKKLRVHAFLAGELLLLLLLQAVIPVRLKGGVTSLQRSVSGYSSFVLNLLTVWFFCLTMVLQ